MELKTPLLLKLKLGGGVGGSSTPEPQSPVHPTIISKMTEEEGDQIGSEEEADYDDDWQDEAQGDIGYEEEEDSQQSRQQFISNEDASRERHKKSKKKKKKKEREKEREKERHKHKHHKEKTETALFDEDEPPAKKQQLDHPSQAPSKVSIAAFKELLEVLLQQLRKKDSLQFFVFPVTDVIAPGYSSIINHPMNFSAMHQKIQEGAYTKLSQFEHDLKLICNNCMIYNQPDTIYYKAAKKLLHAGEKTLSIQKVLPLKKEIASMIHLTKEQLGFEVLTDISSLDIEEGSRGSSRISDNENSQDMSSKFESLQEDLSAEEVLEQVQRVSEEAAEKLTLKKPVSTLGFLRQRVDGTTTLNFLTGCEGNNDPNQKEKPISLGLLTGKLTQGSSTLHNYRDDKRSMAKPVKPLYYGTFASFCPSYDSTFANLNKEESEMVYATYGNETAVQYAESICDFSRDCDMAMHLVDQLLNLLTHQQHSRTKAFIEERRRIQQEEQRIHSLLYSSPDEASTSRQGQREVASNFSSLHTLKEIGIDTSFLRTFEKFEQREKIVGSKLNENATLLESLAKEQRARLSKPLPSNLNSLPPPSQNEVKLAEKVTEGLMSVARQVPPGALAPVPIVRRALGITMMPITSESSEQIEVDIEETSSQESTPPQVTSNGIDSTLAGHIKERSRGLESQLQNILHQPEDTSSSSPSRNPNNISDNKLKEMLGN